MGGYEIHLGQRNCIYECIRTYSAGIFISSNLPVALYIIRPFSIRDIYIRYVGGFMTNVIAGNSRFLSDGPAVSGTEPNHLCHIISDAAPFTLIASDASDFPNPMYCVLCALCLGVYRLRLYTTISEHTQHGRLVCISRRRCTILIYYICRPRVELWKWLTHTLYITHILRSRNSVVSDVQAKVAYTWRKGKKKKWKK